MSRQTHVVKSQPGAAWFKPSLQMMLVVALVGTLWFAGGASRGDVPAQIAVRGGVWGILIVAAFVGHRPRFTNVGIMAVLLASAVALPLIQLIPLPPMLWQALPGHAILADAARLSGQPQPWRPWSIVPGATENAAASLVVPVATFFLVIALTPAEQRQLPGLLVCLVAMSALVGTLQFSGNGFDNPLLNDTPGEVSGLFANRNHFALFIAMGCLLIPVWAFRDGRSARWRAPVAFGLALLFALVILASGSRAGMILGVIALGFGLALAWPGIRRESLRYPRWVVPAIVGVMLVIILAIVFASVAAGRAVSIQRALTLDPGQDIRQRGLPTVVAMIREYFPFGSGLGGFDPVFRLHEPFVLLKPTFFNHAHNDFLEILLDAGLPGAVLLFAAIGWWGWMSARAWRGSAILPRLGSALLLLVLVASLFDYPARTPMIMAVVVIGAVWLSRGDGEDVALASPGSPARLYREQDRTYSREASHGLGPFLSHA